MVSANNKSQQSQPIRVLMIDDNPGDVELIREFLGECSGVEFELSEASDLSGGLAKAWRTQVDVILLDLNLPDSHQMETLRETFRAVPWIPIIVLSGHSEAQLILAAVREGARDYLVKGNIDAASLQSAIVRQAEWRRNLEKYRVPSSASFKLPADLR